MRIALVVPGGVDPSLERRVIPALLALIERLARHHEMHVYALHQEKLPGRWELLGAQVYNMGERRPRLAAVQAITRQHRAAPLHIIHSMFSDACGFAAVLAARCLRVPSVVHIAGGELVRLPEIAYGGALTFRGRLREALVLRGASLITAASAPILQQLTHLGLTAQRVPLGADLTAWPPRAPVPRDLTRPARLTHVGSLNRVKDQTTLLEALAQLARAGRSFEMNILGEDILKGEMQALAARLGLGACVRFHGFVPQRRLRPHLEEADLLVVSSRHEAGPLAMLEAAVTGVPTVGTAVGHIAEWSPNAALAVPVGDATALAAGIAALMDDEPRRLAIARAAQRQATHENADLTARLFESIYQRLTG
jgi:glycosyltransferase involved in cell wall biosynthesis